MHAAILALLIAQAVPPPPLPDSSGWGVHVLAIARAPDSAIWVGTYGQGIFVLRKGAGTWERVRSSSDTAAHAISWDFVHAFAFGPKGQIWYGTVGNGWGVSMGGGKTWKNWEFRQLGPEWQYVTPNGIGTRGDTTYIATADGVKLTWDDGQTWRVIKDSLGATTAKDSVWATIGNQYAQSLVGGSELRLTHLRGRERSRDGGRTWSAVAEGNTDRPSVDSLPGLTVGAPGLVTQGRIVTSLHPRAPRHTWFRRPIALTDQPHIDQTYRFGSTMGGNFQPHQGVEFNNPDGTPVHAIGDGCVVHAGPAEAGALTVAIRHDRRIETLRLFSAYYHNSKLLVQPGQRVKAGAVIALVGNTGRATNDHLHLEVHASPYDSPRFIVDAAVRYPPYNANPELWIEALAGTGIVAGEVLGSEGTAGGAARIYGLVEPQPPETPFSFLETDGPRHT